MIAHDVQTVTQFSVTLINKPGSLAKIIESLSDGKADIAAMTLVDTSEHGTVRLVFNSGDTAARKILKEQDAASLVETEVLAVTMDNRPGAIAELAGKLAKAKVNIHYAYVTSGAAGGKTIGIFRVSDTSKALKLLKTATNKKRRDTSGTVKTLAGKRAAKVRR